MSTTAKGEFKKAMHVYRLTADKVQLGTAGGYGWQPYPIAMIQGGTFPTALQSPITTGNALQGRYRIVDTTCEVKVDIQLTTAANPSGGTSTSQYILSLPPGCIVRSVVAAGNTTLSPQCAGDILIRTGSPVAYTGAVNLTPAVSGWSAFIGTTGVATVAWGSASAADAQWTTTSTIIMGAKFSFELDPSSPILAEAPIQISNGLGTVLPVTQAGNNSGSLITSQFT